MFIFGDTNLWIDLNKLHLVPKTFELLNKVFCMEENMLKEEVIYPEDLAPLLLQCGLQKVSMTETEFQKTFEYRSRHPKLSFYDATALSVAGERNWVLISGDGPLRKAAQKENIQIKGILWILEELCIQKLLDTRTLQQIGMQIKNDSSFRIPHSKVDELMKKYPSPKY